MAREIRKLKGVIVCVKILINDIDFQNLKSRDFVKLECEFCHSPFYRTKNEVQKVLAGHTSVKLKHCCRKCAFSTREKEKTMKLKCEQCGKDTKKQNSQLRKHKHHFCSSSCSATYINTHKTKGYRRSKLEIWLQEKLFAIYPSLEVHYARKDAINGELDIYIPSLKLAFELNGISHYEPIYGLVKLGQVQTNDKRKFQACLEREIELCILDTSRQKKFSPQDSLKYLKIIQNLIDNKLVGKSGFEPPHTESQSVMLPLHHNPHN